MPYQRFSREKLILRDVLALDRTRLANERTFLSYARTAIMVFGSGLTLMKIFHDSPYVIYVGWLLMVTGIGTIVFGGYRLISTSRNLNQLNTADLQTDE